MQKKLLFIKNNFGKIPFCNRKPSRAPHIGSFCFPLCWRCTSITFAYFITMFFSIWFCYSSFFWIIGILLLFPMAIDGGIQTFFKIESTNFRRIVTGILGGIGTYLIISALNRHSY